MAPNAKWLEGSFAATNTLAFVFVKESFVQRVRLACSFFTRFTSTDEALVLCSVCEGRGSSTLCVPARARTTAVLCSATHWLGIG